jgi:hypothetical protein
VIQLTVYYRKCSAGVSLTSSSCTLEIFSALRPPRYLDEKKEHYIVSRRASPGYMRGGGLVPVIKDDSSKESKLIELGLRIRNFVPLSCSM